MFEVGDTIKSKDARLSSTYIVVAVTTGSIVYARATAGNFVRVLLATDYVKLEADNAPRPVPVLRV